MYRFGKEIKDTAATIPSLFSRLSYFFSCVSHARTLEFDIVEGSNFVGYLPAAYIAWHKKKPSVAFYADVLLGRWQELFGPVLGMIGEVSERMFLKLPWVQYIAISNAVKQRLVAQRIPEQKVSVITCGTELPKHRVNKAKQKKIIVISRLVPYKRVDWAVRLLSEIESQYPELTMTIVGSGPQECALAELVKTLHLEPKVQFLKHISKENLYSQLEQSKLLVHPSLIEGFGIVLVEANTYGVPYVSADIPTAVELTGKLGGGALFKQDSFDDFVMTVKNLLINDKVWSHFQEQGMRNASSYDWNKIADETEKLYQTILNKKYVHG